LSVKLRFGSGGMCDAVVFCSACFGAEIHCDILYTTYVCVSV